ncbi:5343_t:CDS:1, partial [Funneliformis mosseae]
ISPKGKYIAIYDKKNKAVVWWTLDEEIEVIEDENKTSDDEIEEIENENNKKKRSNEL